MNLGLYQNCIFKEDFDRLAPGFEPLDFTHNPRPSLREFQIFQHIFDQRLYANYELLGAVSINFEKKAKLNGNDIRNWIEANPGYDVYIVNPFPQFAYCHLNLWQFSDNRSTFPFTERSAQSLEECGVPGLVNPQARQSNAALATCSYWFGNSLFWERYMTEVVIEVLATDPARLSPEVRHFLYEPTYYYANYANRGVPVGNIAFLLERTLSEFVVREKDTIRSLFFPIDRQRLLRCCLFEFEREIIRGNADRVDALDRQGSPAELRAYFDKISPGAASQWTQHFETLGRDKVYG